MNRSVMMIEFVSCSFFKFFYKFQMSIVLCKLDKFSNLVLSHVHITKDIFSQCSQDFRHLRILPRIR